jgi:hypothetical protein
MYLFLWKAAHLFVTMVLKALAGLICWEEVGTQELDLVSNHLLKAFANVGSKVGQRVVPNLGMWGKIRSPERKRGRTCCVLVGNAHQQWHDHVLCLCPRSVRQQ